MLAAEKARYLGYFDEFNFMLANDDHDFHCRALLDHGWRTGYVWAGFDVKVSEGGVSLFVHTSLEKEDRPE